MTAPARSKLTLVVPRPISPERAALAAAITGVKVTESGLEKLRDAADRARDQRLVQTGQLRDAEHMLASTRDKETSRARQNFIDRVEDASPLPQAEAAVVQARSALSTTESLEASIESEIEATERRLDHQRHRLDEAIGQLLVESPELAALNTAIRDCWARLRSLRAAGAAISSAIPASAPHRTLSAWEPIESINVGDPRDAVDYEFIAEWRDAVIALHTDPETILPGG